MKFLHSLDGQLDRLHAGHTSLAAEVIRGHEEDGESWEELLVEAGLPEVALGEVRDVVDREADRRAWHRACEVLQFIGTKLTCASTHSAAVAAALGIMNLDGAQVSFAEVGARLGASKQAVSNRVAMLRELFGTKQPAARHAIERPDPPGRWMTAPEIRTEFGLACSGLRSLGARSVMLLKSNRVFFDADDVAAKLRERAIGEAAKRAAVDREELEYRRRARDAERAPLTTKPSSEAPPPPP